MIARALLLAGLAAPSLALAQAPQCAPPAVIAPVHAELPRANEPQRLLPIGSYTLAVSWSPEHCYAHGRDPDSRFECEGGQRFGFTLHGLWPDGIGPEWPQYCRSTALLPRKILRENLCATPSAQLIQHEWAKHGTCTGFSPDQYFARSASLYRKLSFPGLASGPRAASMTAGELAATIAQANPGLSPESMRITANRSGWLEEIWFCLDKRFAYTRCAANSGGVPPATRLRIASPRSARFRDDAYRGGGE